MNGDDPRAALAALIRERGTDCAALSRLIGRNPAYVQQFLQRGTPRRLAEADRAVLARFFGVAETVLGAPPSSAPQSAPQSAAPMAPHAGAHAGPALRLIPRLDLAASAGPGALAEDGRTLGELGMSEAWLRRLKPSGPLGRLSLIAVAGDSMAPTLAPGDEILVDHADTMRRDGVFVLRQGDALLVKRLRREGGRIAVTSDNPDAPPVPDDPATTVIGRVIWAGRRL